MSQTKAQLISDLVQALNFTGTASAPANGAFLSATNTLALATNSAQRLTIDSTGDVGIGTSSPTFSTFGSNTGGIEISDVGSGANALLVQSSSNEFFFANTSSANYIFGADSAPIIISTNGSERMRIKSNGTVGIGTTNPETNLHVQGAGDGMVRITSADGSSAFLDLGDASDKDGGRIQYNTDSSLRFSTVSTERMRIDSSGRVLIGATSARSIANINCKTQIEATDGTAALSITRNDDAAAASTCRLNFGRTRATSIGGVTAVTTNDILGEIRFSGSDGTDLTNHAASIGAVVDGSVSSNTVPGRLVFNTATGSDPVERMRITSAGRVGIGNTSPQSEIHIGAANNTSHEAMIILNNGGATGQEAGIEWRYENITAPRAKIHVNSSDQILRFSTADNERMRIDTSGRVIIGSTSTIGNQYTDNLTISEAAGDAGIQIEGNNSNSNYASIYFGDAGSRYRSFFETQLGANGNFTIATTGSGPIRFNNSGGERMRIDGSGRLLIGTTTTTSNQSGRLNVFGTNGDDAFFSIRRGSNNASGPRFAMCKSRNTSDGSFSGGTVQNGDILGTIHFYANDSQGFEEGAAIAALIDGTPGSNDVPTRLTFSTTPDGSDTKAERMTIKNDGKVGIGDSNPQSKLAVSDGGSTADPVIMAHVANSNGALLGFGLYSTVNSAYTFKVTNNGRVHAKDGIIFGTDTATANVLDDYEEGTWNPDPDDGNNVFTHGQEQGRYIKIGHVVHCTFSINVSLSGTSGFAMFMTGLPFTVKDFSENTNEGLSTARGTGQAAQLEAQQGQTKFKYRNPSSGAAMSVNDVGCTNNTVKSLRGAITYITT